MKSSPESSPKKMPLKIIPLNIGRTDDLVSLSENGENYSKKLSSQREEEPSHDLNPPRKRHCTVKSSLSRGLLCLLEFKPHKESLHSTDIEDSLAKEEVRNQTLQEGFKQELVAKFAGMNSTEIDSIKIEKLRNSKGVNAESHFIINHGEKKYHAKPALHGKGISLGSKFNEITFYKLNEILKIGPRSNGIVSENGVLMIITEDLSSRTVGNAENKTISFTDNEESRGVKKDVVEAIPSRHRDNVHRCATEIVINLLFYADVQKNYANTGFKITKKIIDGDLQEIKEKPFIIDFRLSTNEDLYAKYEDYVTNQSDEIKKYAEIIGSYLDDESPRAKIPIDVFDFNQNDPEIIKDALKKLFLTEDGDLSKFDKAISTAFDFAISLARESGMLERDLTDNIANIEIQKQKTILHVNTFLENPKIISFLEEEGRKIKEKLSPQAITSSPSVEASRAISIEV